MLRVWAVPLMFAVSGAAIAAARIAGGSPVAGVVIGLLFLAAGAGFSPLLYPRHTPAAVARQRASAEGRPVVYWRPGCPYCLRLRLSLLGRARRASWVNIWRDPAGAAAVRAVADGNETVPTVALPGGAHVNPDPLWLRRHLLDPA